MCTLGVHVRTYGTKHAEVALYTFAAHHFIYRVISAFNCYLSLCSQCAKLLCNTKPRWGALKYAKRIAFSQPHKPAACCKKQEALNLKYYGVGLQEKHVHYYDGPHQKRYTCGCISGIVIDAHSRRSSSSEMCCSEQWQWLQFSLVFIGSRAKKVHFVVSVASLSSHHIVFTNNRRINIEFVIGTKPDLKPTLCTICPILCLAGLANCDAR